VNDNITLIEKYNNKIEHLWQNWVLLFGVLAFGYAKVLVVPPIFIYNIWWSSLLYNYQCECVIMGGEGGLDPNINVQSSPLQSFKIKTWVFAIIQFAIRSNILCVTCIMNSYLYKYNFVQDIIIVYKYFGPKYMVIYGLFQFLQKQSRRLTIKNIWLVITYFSHRIRMY